jgi:hypothetical protein
MAKANATEAEYIVRREELRSAGNSLIALQEIDGTIGQYIVIDTNCIEYTSDPL